MATAANGDLQGYLYQPFSVTFHRLDDGSGNSALLQCVEKEDVKGALKLLSNGRDPNYQNPNTGYSALHIAVKKHNPTLVKLLIIFDADLQLKDNDGLTPLELAEREGEEDAECAKAIRQVQDLRLKLQEDKPRETAARSEPRMPTDDDIFLLTLDGGGIKGLVFIQILIEIEKRCKQLYPGSKKFLSYFNWIGGNSTGGIAALAVAGLEYHPRQGRRLYLHLKDKVLAGDFPFPDEAVESVFKNAFGTEKTMSSIKSQNVAIMTTLATKVPPKLHIMTNYGDPRDDLPGPDERLVWEAARATSAAIPYFNPFADFIDGGFIANNPTTDTVIDILLHTKNQKRIKLVLSMGCGYIEPKSIALPTFSPPSWIVANLAKLIGMHDELFYLKNLGSTTALIKLMAAQVMQPCSEVSHRAKMISERAGAKYFRLNPEIEDISFIEHQNEHIIDMMYTTLVNTLKPTMMEKIDEVIDLVVASNPSQD